ncbi:Uncharacterised protein [uncultured archaeon]|nr:Uncharacterised protein [uncultured archaeon]
MKKTQLEITMTVVSLVIFIISIVASKLIIPTSPGYGYAVALLVYVILMGVAGLKLAEIPDK